MNTVKMANNNLLFTYINKGDLKGVQEALKRGAKVNCYEPEPCRSKRTPLSCAIDAKHLDIIKRLLLAGASLNTYNNNQFPIQRAIDKGDLNVVKFLIENGADIFLKCDYYGHIALSYAISRKVCPEIINHLQKETCCRINHFDKGGKTPLIKAVEKKSLGLVKILTENGAQTWLAGKNGVTPLTIAVMKSNADIVKFLLENGGKCTVPAAFSCAIEHHSVEMVKILVEQGDADVNMSFKDGSFPLMKAVDFNCLSVVQYFIEKGAVISQIDKSGLCTLARCVEKGNYKIFKFLIDNKADIHQLLPSVKNILSIAAIHRHLSIVIDLIELGADISKAEEDLQEYASCDENFSCFLNNRKILLKTGHCDDKGQEAA